MPVTVMAPELASRLRAAELTYSEAGHTARVLPPGYHHLRRSVLVGSGAQAFTEAGQVLGGWHAHLRAGLHVSASSPAAEPGAVLVLSLGVGPLRIGAPCRVVYVVDEPSRRGFAYGTLPGHPERGEEAFLITHHDDGTVTFAITAFSAPGSPLARAAGPLGRAIQRHITSRYLRAVAG